MAKRVAEEISEEAHPYDFHVSGPRNLSTPNWREIINSSWKDVNYRRTVVACFVQAVYLLELDRQENRSEDNALAPKWWRPFKYKLSQTLVDDRDSSIFGAIFEWDRASAMSDFILIRPSGAPRAVLALRGTLLKTPTIRRDLEDDLRFLTWESLKGSIRFTRALEALKLAVERFGSCNVWLVGHSLGAGLALQIGKAFAKQGIYIETHLFNPPSVSLAMGLKSIGEKAEYIWKRIKSAVELGKAKMPSNSSNEVITVADIEELEKSESEGKMSTGLKKWVPHLYLNNSDYICCYYMDPAAGPKPEGDGEEGVKKAGGQLAAKLFVMSKGPQKFLEAHGLEQWWSHDMELQLALHNSKLINRQLKSLYTIPPQVEKP